MVPTGLSLCASNIDSRLHKVMKLKLAHREINILPVLVITDVLESTQKDSSKKGDRRTGGSTGLIFMWVHTADFAAAPLQAAVARWDQWPPAAAARQ